MATLKFKDPETGEVRKTWAPTVDAYSKTQTDSLLANKVPTTRKINGKALSSDVTLGLDDIGAAPAGYGLGAAPVELPSSDFNNVIKSGWYAYGNPNSYANAPSIGYCPLMVMNRADDTIVQVAVNGAGKTVRRVHVNGAWSAWEWIDPPMAEGVEYRTTERYLNYPVYAKIIYAGDIAGSTSVTIDIVSVAEGEQSPVNHIVSIEGMSVSSNQVFVPSLVSVSSARGRHIGTITLKNSYTSTLQANYVLVKYTKYNS